MKLEGDKIGGTGENWRELVMNGDDQKYIAQMCEILQRINKNINFFKNSFSLSSRRLSQVRCSLVTSLSIDPRITLHLVLFWFCFHFPVVIR